MSSQKTSFIRWVSLLSLAVPAAAHADFYLHHWEDQIERSSSWRLQVESQYYSSTQNYGPTGTSDPIPSSSGKYSRFQSDALIAKTLGNRLTAFGRLSWAYISLSSTSATAGNGTATASASTVNVFGLTDQTVGLNLRAFDIGQDLATLNLQAQLDIPAYSNLTTATADDVFKGDGSYDATIGGFVDVPLSQSARRTWTAIGGVGYTKRSDGFSSAVPYSVMVQTAPSSEGFFANAGVFGISSLKNDPRGNGPVVVSRLNGAGGSLMVNAVNPTIANFRTQIGYQLSPTVLLHGTLMLAMAGQSAPAGMSIGLGIQMHLGGSGPSSRNKSNEGFINYSLEAKVTRSSDRLNLVKIDKGTSDGVEPGQIFDIFAVKQDGSISEAVARAKVVSARSKEAALQISEYFKEVWIEEGFVAKRPLK